MSIAGDPYDPTIRKMMEQEMNTGIFHEKDLVLTGETAPICPNCNVYCAPVNQKIDDPANAFIRLGWKCPVCLKGVEEV